MANFTHTDIRIVKPTFDSKLTDLVIEKSYRIQTFKMY